MRESHADERREHDAAIARPQAEHDQLQNRIHAMYVDKLDGRIDKHFFDKLSGEFRSEQARCIREITWHQAADQSYLEEGVRLLDLAHDARRLFAKQEPHEKRRLLYFVLSNSTWKNGELSVTFRQPFDLLAQTTAIVARGNGGNGLTSPGHPGWLQQCHDLQHDLRFAHACSLGQARKASANAGWIFRKCGFREIARRLRIERCCCTFVQALPRAQTTPSSCNRFRSAGPVPHSAASTASVCSPSSGGRLTATGESDSLMGQPTVW